MYNNINEGLAKLKILKAKKISKEMAVFYNPAMKLNRDISVLLLNSLRISKLQIADPLAATVVRSIRFLKDLGNGKIRIIYVNDYGKDAVKLIRENFTLNNIKYASNKKSFEKKPEQFLNIAVFANLI